MTNYEAIKVLENEIKCVDRDCDIERSCGKCPYAMPTKDPILEAYNMAIKALNQEPILDKIRAEIESLEYLNIEDGSDGYDKYIEQYEVLKIIDKYLAEYKVESEGEE